MTRTATMVTTSSDGAMQVGNGSGDQAGTTKPKRKRSPNKPKLGTIEVKAEASMSQAAIVDLLNAHAVKMVGADVAADMELQVNFGDGWRPPADVPPHGAIIRFATKGHK